MKGAAAWVVMLALAGCGGSSPEAPTFPVASAPRVQKGMTKAEVRTLLGPPHHMIALDGKCPEEWKYENPGSTWEEYFTFHIAFDPSGAVCGTKMNNVRGR